MRTTTFPARFWAKVSRGPECWEWTGHRADNGYGRSWDAEQGRTTYAHRVAYRLARGPIPAGMQLDHLCRNRACVRPDHLEAVPQATNILRGDAPGIVAHRAGTCTYGHSLALEAHRRTRGPRAGEVAYCRACRRERRAA